MTAATETTAQLLIPPWFRDHCLDGKGILPAVEALEFLAELVHRQSPELDCRRMTAARFPRFLELVPGQQSIEVLVSRFSTNDGGVRAVLQTRKQLRTMTRLNVHCEVVFGAAAAPPAPPLPSCGKPVMAIAAERIYRDLVPFGPAYRTLQGQVDLEPISARGLLVPPFLPGDRPDRSLLGSPFAMDGAMHLACVHGQGLVDFVPFPVGLAQRTVREPTRSGEPYQARACLRGQTREELVYDLEIVDQRQRVRETVLGLRMRDVSGGRIKPAEWINKALKKADGGEKRG
ncbi:MAG: polyketide synthase dehydratase domain-containing protein [Desulfobulbus sp.]